MNNYLLLLPIGIVIICIIAIIIYLINNSKKNKEETASILDVNDEVGVPSSSEFSYGYEKEETVVMNPVNESSLEENSQTKEESSNDEVENNNESEDN